MQFSVSTRKSLKPTFHLKYLQFILIEINVDRASKEFDIIWYSQKTFRLSTKAEMKNKVCKYKNSDKLVEKTVTIIVKVAL